MTAPRKQGRKNAARKAAAYTTFLAIPAAGRIGGLASAIPRCCRPRTEERHFDTVRLPPARAHHLHAGVVCYTAPPRQEKRTLLPALCSRFSRKATAQRARRSAPRSGRARPCGDAGFYKSFYGRKSANRRVFGCGVLPSVPIKRKEQDYENKANHNKTRRR